MYKRSLSLLALGSIAGMAFAQDTSVHITYTSRASRITEVLKGLSQVSKVNLQTSPVMSNEIVLISVTDKPLSEVMAQIATVTSGDWKQEGAVYRLIANPTVRRSEDRALVAKRAADFRKALKARTESEVKRNAEIEKMVAKAAAKAKTDPKGKAADTKSGTKVEAGGNDDSVDFPADARFGDNSPEETAITRLLMGLDANVVGQIEMGDRLVFSTDPTRMQRGLGSDANDIINTFIAKHNEQVAKIPPDEVQDAGGAIGADDAMTANIRNMMKMRSSKIGQVSKGVLVFKQSGRMGFGFNNIELRLYDAKGVTVYSANSSLGMESMMEGMTTEMTTSDSGSATVTSTVQKPATPPSGKQTPIEYSEDSKAMMTTMKMMGSGNFKLGFSPELKKKLFLPATYDPLSFTESDEFLAYAKSVGKPIVADITDDAGWSNMGATAMGSPGGSGATVESVTAALKEGKTMSIVPDPNYAVLKPTYPTKSRAIRVDRVSLANLMRAVDEKTIPSLDDMSAYALENPDPSLGGFASGYMMLFVPGGMMEGFSGLSNWNMLRFYGHLSPDARITLNSGGKLSFSTLSAGQKAAVDQMIYGADGKLSIEDPNKKSEAPFPSFLAMMGGEGGNLDYREEPTEIVPNGLPGDGYLDLNGSREAFAVPQSAGDSAFAALFGVLGPDEMALFKMMSETKGAEAFTNMLPNMSKLRIGERSVMNFTFHLAPLVSVKQTLKDNRLPKDAPVVAQNALPSDFQKQIADRLAALKKSPLGGMGGMFGGETIHP